MAADRHEPVGVSPEQENDQSPRGTRSTFDQQPIEATATIMAARAALEVNHDPRYRRAAEAAFGWFLGDSVVGIPVALPGTGSCHDGLAPRHVNGNQRAESTLMWLTAGPGGDPLVTGAVAGDLFQRSSVNPIITVDQLPYRANSVFNPAPAGWARTRCSSSGSRTCAASPTCWSPGAGTASRTGGSARHP